MFIVIVGTLFGNKTVHGPFQNWDHANQWASVFVSNQHYEIVKLEKINESIICRKKTS